MTLSWLEPMILVLIPFVESWAMSFHLKTKWWWEKHIQIFSNLWHYTTRACFRVVVGSQIVVSPTISPAQWYSCDSNSQLWFWYHLSDRELCHSTSKLISDEEDTLKSFMAFDITPHGLVFRVVVGSQNVVPPTLYSKYIYSIPI